MAYPIKYIENNLVWNKDGECYAYYELVPYNYSFLSPEQKIQVHDSFRQLIAQNRDGKIHALQISTESSIRSAQERSKNEVTGKLKAVAYDKIDQQTDALISMIGENQVNYRFFIGFKLLLNDQEFSMKSLTVEAKNALSDFVYDVNHKLMGDFVSMSNDEILRFQKMEKLLENKISRRFKIRRLDKDDFGYLIEHLYGQTGTAYEEYEYHLSKKKLDNETLIKYYDLIKPTRCLVEEKQRYLKIQQEDETVYVAYFTINSIVGELDFPSSEIFYYQQQQFTFPIDTSMNVEIVANRKALSTVRNKKKELKDLDNHAWQSDNETSSNVAEALESVNELETNLDQSKESMYKLSYVVRVSANDLDELKRRCNEVKDFYDDLSVKLVRPFGDMLGLHEEFLPASKRYMNDYIQYVTSDFLAGLGFGATQMLGENEGIYVGYSLDTGRNVYLKPALASQGVKGSVTNALASAFVGSLGGGKSFANNLIVYYAVLYGAQAVIVDPKAERGRWKETLPEISHEINIVTLTSDEKNKGLLDPYVIMKNPKDSESLAIDILTFLTGISSRDGERFPILRKAIRAVTNSEVRGLMKVIEELRVENSGLKEQVKDLPTNARYAVYQGKSKVKENVRDLTSSISQTKADRASGRKEQQEQRRKTIAKRRSEMEQVKQKKQPASSVHERPTTRQEQYHDEQTSKQSNIQTSYKESQQAKQERPAVKSDFSSPKVERQGNTVQEKTVQKPATSTTTADRTSQRPITKERPSTVQRVPLQNTRSRPPIKTATIKKVGKKP